MIENIKDFNMLAIYEPTYPVLALAKTYPVLVGTNLLRVGMNQPTPCWYEPTYPVLVWTNLPCVSITNLPCVSMNQPALC